MSDRVFWLAPNEVVDEVGLTSLQFVEDSQLRHSLGFSPSSPYMIPPMGIWPSRLNNPITDSGLFARSKRIIACS
jgi:hypothetical protein